MVKPTRLVNELGISSKTEDGGDRCGRKKEVDQKMIFKPVHNRGFKQITVGGDRGED